MLRAAAVLIDIEGTTTPRAFIRDVLFPFARERMASLISERGGEPAVASELELVRAAAPGKPALDTLLHWMDIDSKASPLKALQGIIWDDGYRQGVLKGGLFPDVPSTLRNWHCAGLRLYVYSYGSVAAQKLIFAHSDDGELGPIISGFFDTRVGGKRDHETYGRLAIALNLPPVEVLYLSAVEDELDAAAAAGLRTCQLVRPSCGTAPSESHAAAPDFPSVGSRMSL